MPKQTPITVHVLIEAPIGLVWTLWTGPEHVKNWNNASDDWHTPSATNDLREGGTFSYRMEATDGSAGFDFEGTYTTVIPQERIEYAMSDGRSVSISFEDHGDSVRVAETFDAENENPAEMQRQGWQAILNNFKKYVESQ